MEKFEVTILGCGSALPTLRHHPSCQIVNVREKLFMIDCGEGAQLQMRKAKIRFSRLTAIFISHLHGDHCFGLIGLLSTLSLLGRTAPLRIYAPKELPEMLDSQLKFYADSIRFSISFHAVNTQASELVYEDKSLTVRSIPLRHRIPCAGYLFCEKPLPPRIRKDMIDFYRIPVCAINRIKNGEDWTDEEGNVIPRRRLLFPPDEPRSYAYCSDTILLPGLKDLLRGVNLLYHEATFCRSEEKRAKEVFHSTAEQAAQLAKAAEAKKLMIGHFSARYDDETQLLQEAQSVFPATIAAKELLKEPVR